jgi:hypothetical protein
MVALTVDLSALSMEQLLVLYWVKLYWVKLYLEQMLGINLVCLLVQLLVL